jgi:hypothetical protein
MPIIAVDKYDDLDRDEYYVRASWEPGAVFPKA